jgi:hypothetical protein
MLIFFSYWLAKIKWHEKIRQNSALPSLSIFERALPPISKQNQWWYG